MLRETLSATDMINYPLFAFLLFMATFLVVVVRVLMKRRDDAMTSALAALPLEADELGAPPEHSSQGSHAPHAHDPHDHDEALR